MNKQSHQVRIVLLQAILVCLLAVNVHAAGHFGADGVDCKSCSTHHDPLDVIVAAEANSLLLPATPKPFEQRIQQLRVASFFSFQQRGPPLSIS